MMAAIESAAGVLNAKEIALASKRLRGIAIGAEDYVTDLKTSRSPEGLELLFGRSMVLLAARTAGIDAIDTVYSDVNNEEGLRKETALIRQLGFDGKSVINPRQIKIVHEIFTPSDKEIKNALAVIGAIKEANARGSGVIALNGKMIDKPVVTRAERVLDLARAAGVRFEEDEETV
jgi:citrate lyase subunit beta/citryl-CoA lyase